jgi:L-rhamnose isomerase / sugar isomerase
MKIDRELILRHNVNNKNKHREIFEPLSDRLSEKGLNVEDILEELGKLQIAIPSWALGTGGTRFGRFPGGGEPGILKKR